MQGIPQGPNQQGGSQKPSLSWSGPGSSKPVVPQAPKPMAQKPNDKKTGEKSNMTTYAGIFVAGLIVGGLLGAAFTGQRPASNTNSDMAADTGSTSTMATTTDTGTNPSGPAMVGGLQGLVVPSGQTPGPTVAISSISVQEPTWVVIYDDNNGLPGRTLGAQLFFPLAAGGETSGTVSLLRNTLAGHSYIAGERIDNGDHAYSTVDDHLVLGDNSQQLMVQFNTK